MERECDNAVRYGRYAMYASWLTTALKKSGISQAALARELTSRLGRSIDRAAVNKMASGLRRMSADELLATAAITGQPAPGGKSGVVPVEVEQIGLPVLGAIQAGAWLDISLLQSDSEPPMLPIARDPRFPSARQYCLQVIGDSMDMVYPDPSYVTCVDFAESGLPIRAGLTVHVERRDGERAEITLKVIERVGGKLRLVPRSTNPKYKPIDLDSKDGIEVIIRGVVTGGWKQTAI